MSSKAAKALIRISKDKTDNRSAGRFTSPKETRAKNKFVAQAKALMRSVDYQTLDAVLDQNPDLAQLAVSDPPSENLLYYAIELWDIQLITILISYGFKDYHSSITKEDISLLQFFAHQEFDNRMKPAGDPDGFSRFETEFSTYCQIISLLAQ